MNTRRRLTLQLGKDPGVWINQQVTAGRTLADAGREIGLNESLAKYYRLDAGYAPLRKPRFGQLSPDGSSVASWLKANGYDMKAPVVINRLVKGWTWERAISTPPKFRGPNKPKITPINNHQEGI